MRQIIRHDLDEALAKKTVEKAFDAYKQRFAKYDVQTHWVDSQHARISFKVKGMTLQGQMELTSGAINVDLDVPFLLRPFQKLALDAIDREVLNWVGKAKSGQLA